MADLGGSNVAQGGNHQIGGTQGQTNVRVQSERYLSSAGNGSQQSLSSKMLKGKKKTAKY